MLWEKGAPVMECKQPAAPGFAPSTTEEEGKMTKDHTARFYRNLTLGLALLSLLGLLFGLTALATAQAETPADSVTAPVGTTITVNTGDDDLSDNENCTLREAILAANTDTAVDLCPGGSGTDTITFAANYTITLGSALPAISNSVTISGNGTAHTIVQASTCDPVNLPGGCTPADWRVFTVMTGTHTLKGLTVRHGNCDNGGGCPIDDNDGGNIYATAADLTLDGVNVQNGYAENGGGGIYSDGGALTLQNKTLVGGPDTGNKVGDLGGGVLLHNGSAFVVDNSRIAYNHANNYGGGVELRDGSSATVRNGSWIDHNKTVEDYGGGIYVEGTGTQLVVDASTISHNSSTQGGGISVDSTGSRAQIENGSIVSSNTVTGTGTVLGGGINNRGTLTISNSTVMDNWVTSPDELAFGGGIYNSGSLVVIKSTVSGNTASGFPTSWGGGIYNDATLQMTSSTLSGNVASGADYGYGGGIGSDNGTIDITSSTFTDNSASGTINGHGGAIDLAGIIVTVTNSTFYSNSATHRGGGIHNYQGTLDVLNSTLSGNSSDSAYGGGIDNQDGTLSLTNTILANSLSGYDCASTTALTGDSHNLIESNNGCGTPALTTDPVLGALAGNGGDTQTMALLTGSPAIDAAQDAACPATDQRGIGRPQGDHCDIGAFELDPIPLSVVVSGSGSGTVTSDPAGIDCGADCSQIYDYGTGVTLTATADTGSTFAGWSGDAAGGSPVTVTMNGSKSITATFDQAAYTLTVTILGDGSVGRDPDLSSYTYGDVVTLTALADPGWTFDGWSGDLTATASPVTVTIDSDKAITATFTEEPVNTNYMIYLPYVGR